MGKPSILIVEDDLPLAELLRSFLAQNGFATSVESNGLRAAERIVLEPPALILLDITLPGLDGLAICRQVRPTFPGSILMLTARGDDADVVRGLDLGADDYIAKPVKPRVLLARVRALLRRNVVESSTAPEPLVVG